MVRDGTELATELRNQGIAAERERVRAVLLAEETMNLIRLQLVGVTGLAALDCDDEMLAHDIRIREEHAASKVVAAIAARLGIDLAQPAGKGDDNGK